jgi:DNA-binding NarL/FixJ family response regulator
MPLRILVADDHPVVRRGIRALLEGQADWQVCGEAATGREAVEQAKRLDPDIVVLDLSMPEMNGLDATRLIARDAPRTQVLVLTMHRSEELAHQVVRAGAKGYVLKSDADRELVAAVDSLQRRRSFRSPSLETPALDGRSGGQGEEGTGGWGDLTDLTPREREIVQLVAEGRSSKVVAAELGISVKTVESHRTNVMRKLRIRSVSQLVRYAVRNGLVQA